MDLLLDIGNSRIKWAFLEMDELTGSGSAPYRDRNIKGIFESLWSEFPAPQRVLAVSVARQETVDGITDYVSQRWDVRTELIKAEKKAFGVTNAYQEPDRLGADRWLAMLAAYNKKKAPVCVIDCGTAVTIDVVTGEGQHRGGLIIPGLEMMRQSLVNNTGGIVLDKESDKENDFTLSIEKCLATNTHQAVTGGTLYTLIATIDRVVTDVSNSMSGELSCLITGGDAPVIAPYLSVKCQHEPNLVLEGLAMRVGTA